MKFSTAVENTINPTLGIARRIILRYPRSVVLTSLATALFPWLIGNYRAFYSLGHSGLGQGLSGWLIATSLKPLGRQTLTTEEYDKDPNQDVFLKDPASIPERRGARPLTGWHFTPHRQINRIPTQKVAERLDSIFKTHANANSNLVDVVRSPHERVIDAMIIKPSIPSPHKVADDAIREIAHVHPADHSVHAVLAPQDCKTIIERGWGERHPLSGVNRFIPLPKEYLIIYAPRDDEELDVVERIIVASIGYMTNSRGVN